MASDLLVTEKDVRMVKAPEPTATWFPFEHALVLDELELARKELGLVPATKRYELSKDGKKFFGVWSFDFGHDIHSSVGFRNSIDRTLAVGLTAGTLVTVCSNLAFNGTWLQFRKHTKYVLDDLREFVRVAFDKSLSVSKRDVEWQRSLVEYRMSLVDWKTMTYDALDAGVLALSKSAPLFEHKGERNLSVWFNIITNILSNRSLVNSEDQFANLRFMVDNFISEDFT